MQLYIQLNYKLYSEDTEWFNYKLYSQFMQVSTFCEMNSFTRLINYEELNIIGTGKHRKYIVLII